jgi:hypothetical protein
VTYSADRPAPYLNCTTYEVQDAPGYFRIFGGCATTGLLDGLEVAEHVLRWANQACPLSREDIVQRISQGLPDSEAHGMIWNYAPAMVVALP